MRRIETGCLCRDPWSLRARVAIWPIDPLEVPARETGVFLQSGLTAKPAQLRRFPDFQRNAAESLCNPDRVAEGAVSR